MGLPHHVGCLIVVFSACMCLGFASHELRTIPEGCVVDRSGGGVVLTDCHMYTGETLDLHNTGLTGIGPIAFVGTRLRKLYLHENKLTSLDKLVFQHAYRLTDLRLDSNKITSLPWGTYDGIFDMFTSIERLHLDDNLIQELHPRLFEVIGRTLTDLSLSNNRITELHPSIFATCSKLKQLQLIGNPLDLERISPSVFEPLTQLQYSWWRTVGPPTSTFVPGMQDINRRTSEGKHRGTYLSP